MAEYLIYFNQQWVGDHTEEWFRSRGPLAMAVVNEIKAAGEYVFAGGLDEDVDLAFSADATSGTLLFTDGPFVETKEYLGGLTVVDVDDVERARMWAGKIAEACGWPQEVRPFGADARGRLPAGAGSRSRRWQTTPGVDVRQVVEARPKVPAAGDLRGRARKPPQAARARVPPTLIRRTPSSAASATVMNGALTSRLTGLGATAATIARDCSTVLEPRVRRGSRRRPRRTR